MSLSIDDAAKFGALMRAYAESFYPERHLSDEAICFYFEELRECSMEDIGRALSAHARSGDRCGRFPKPGDLLRHMNSAGEAALESLWQEVLREIRRVGSYGRPSFQDPRTMKAIAALGGWEAIVQSPTQEALADHRRSFLKAISCQPQETLALERASS